MHLAVEERLRLARAALKRGDFCEARDHFTILESLGSDEALLALGEIHRLGGGGVEKDLAISRQWYEKAFSTRQLVSAGIALGKFYYFGVGVAVDYRRAHQYFHALSNTDNLTVLFRLGVMYKYGQGVPRDMLKARNYFRRASGSGNLWAKKNLGIAEIGCGNVFRGILLWGTALALQIVLSVVNPADRRMAVP